jgi:RNA-directed DNA polymerase
MAPHNDIVQLARQLKAVLHNKFYGRSSRWGEVLRPYQNHELNALLLLSVESPAELCLFLQSSFQRFEEIINAPTYRQHVIRKKSGGTRQIFEPGRSLKAIQKRLNYFLQGYYLWVKPAEVHGFVVHPQYLGTYCNIVANAKPHTRKKQVLNIDLKDFFPSITAKQVKAVFTSPLFGFNEQVATALTLLTTYKGSLPVGAPTSPVISNFVCGSLDDDLIKFSKANQLSFTRYADDLTFSSDDDISFDILLDIINLIRKNHFAINEKKIRKRSAHRRQTVTGLTVNKKVNVDRKLLKKIRAMLHDLTTNSIDAATARHFSLQEGFDLGYREKFILRLKGYINFVGQVRGKQDALYLRYKHMYEGIVDLAVHK